MAVPRSSAPVFGRYAGMQGVQSWHSCVGAPPDVGFRPVFSSVAGRGKSYNTEPVLPPEFGKVCRCAGCAELA